MSSVNVAPTGYRLAVITLASVPAAHPYVHAVLDPDHITLLPDPVPAGITQPGQWWPPRLLEPAFLADHIDRIEILHVHFGFDATPAAVLRAVTDLSAAHRVPLVVTVHDLDNPHFLDSAEHRERLGVLVEAAAQVITLTHGAAAEVERRWNRSALVLPHPPVLSPEGIGKPRARRAEPVVAVHAKALRANIDPWPVLDALLPHAGAGWTLRLDIDTDGVQSHRNTGHLDRYASAGVDVRVHPRFTDDDLADYLGEIDVLVLPYRFGTHSGWVEACFDAGVCAVVPDCGFFAQQHDFPVYHYSRTELDAAGLVAAVEAGLSVQRLQGADLRAQRRQLQDEVRDQMTALYRRLLCTAAAA
ncbi:hypothetical protein BST17_06270 [Mycolicibacterium bacteremicum]|uniref:Glycosyltransferase subfamily 4-like N-terminal domain-containing protein n=1 Tax=Mycolicibacterium bacteremicum TaxID=564198 RepID=A0A1W9Z181_MYCBA|nr:hypothetical protein BST17_06270 [Mycolicibacterium bacteremicum]